MCFEKLIFDHLHLPTADESRKNPYLAMGESSIFASRAKLYEYAIHPHMLARMIICHGRKSSGSLLLSDVQKTAKALRATHIQQGLSIGNDDDERDLFAVMIINIGPSQVLQKLHVDARVCREPTSKHVQDAMLALSTYRNDIERVRSILESGAEPDQHSGTFGSVIHTAAAYGHLEIFQLLHQYGADINGPVGGWRGNCLQTAALGGHAEIVRLLLSGDLGLDLQRSDFKPRLEELLYRMPGNGDIGNDLVAAILCAIRSGNDMVIEDLIKQLIKQLEGRPRQLTGIFSDDWIFQRILKSAMKNCRETCLHAALRGTRYNSNILGMCLCNAVSEANQIQVNQILAASTLQDLQPNWTSCALKYAAKLGLVEYLNVILAHGDKLSPFSATCILCSALRSRQHEIVRILIAHRIGIPYGRNSPILALGFAKDPRRRPVGRLRKVREQAPLSAAACLSENLEFFQKFIDNGTSLSHNDAGIWALNIAAWGGNVTAVQILLEAGVDAAAGMPTDPSWTPVKLAAINGRESVVQLLVRWGQENPVIDAVQGRELFAGRPRRRERNRDNDNAT